jgi:DNA-binding MarR family transcriptional regulator
MATTSIDRDRIEAVQTLFDGLVRFGRALKARSGDWGHAAPDLTRGDIVTLGVLEARGSTRPGQIAAALNVDPSVISRQLVSLARLDLISRGTDPEDGRAELISITPQGRERLVQAREAICLALAERLAHWDLDEIDRAAAMVEDLSLHLHQSTSHDSHSSKDAHV